MFGSSAVATRTVASVASEGQNAMYATESVYRNRTVLAKLGLPDVVKVEAPEFVSATACVGDDSTSHGMSYALQNDLNDHTRKVNELTRQVYFLARFSDVSDEQDSRVVSLSSRLAVLDQERKQIIGRLLVEIADFDGYYDFVVRTTIVPSWKGLALNAVGLERAIQYRSNTVRRVPDLSNPEVDAMLTAVILSV